MIFFPFYEMGIVLAHFFRRQDEKMVPFSVSRDGRVPVHGSGLKRLIKFS